MEYLKPLMDKNFLEYASYVIKDRAIPNVEDGVKPVQRRILQTMFKMDDGKYHKVANIIGDTMKLHPHGDASIGAALVVLANKDYFIDKQGNFGNILTGDPASAARYIEARLTPLAKEVLFNPELTDFEDSYDGRNKEPLVFPCKIPVALLLGSDGIAVGMSTSILPHNFNEVLKAQIAYLRGESVELYPDFPTGGLIDISNYQGGMGKVKIRAKVDVVDDKSLVIREVPFGVTTESLIASIQDATNKGKLKISSINDYTTEHAEIELKAVRGIKADSLIKPLFAFTDCEISVSVNLLVIDGGTPKQMPVRAVLEHNTERLQLLLELELELALEKAEKKWHNKKMEILFITNRLYQKLEDCETYEAILEAVSADLMAFQEELNLPITKEDIERLLEIPLKRISKFDQNKSLKELKALEKEIRRIRRCLKDIVGYAIDYLNGLLERYGTQYPRRTTITTFEEINRQEISHLKQKVGWQVKEGYLGTAVKSDVQLMCSPYDRLVIFYTSGLYRVIRVPEKLFVDKDIEHIAKVDNKTVFNLIYFIDSSKVCYAKRFVVKGFILDKEYHLFPPAKGAKILHLSTGDSMKVEVQYSPTPRMKNSKEEFLFDDLAVKGIGVRGNRVSTKAVKRIKPLSSKKRDDDENQLSLLPVK